MASHVPASDIISQLKQVQILDKEIFDLGERIKEIPIKVKALEEAFAKEKATLDKLTHELRALQVKQKEFENDLASKEGAIKKYDGQLALVKTNKEYAALQEEMRGIKADISMVEEKIIGVLDEIETQQSKVNAEKGRLKETEDALNTNKKSLDAERVELAARVSTLTAERSEHLGKVAPDVRSRYESILKNRHGLALTPIVGEICGVCQITIRPQLQNEVKMGNQIVTCESCGRIMYLQ